MRATEYVFLVIVIGIFAMVMISFATDLDTVYTDTHIDTSNFNQYNDFQSVANQANKTFENFKPLGNDEKSWFQKIGAGIVAIPYAVISFPVMLGMAFITLTKFMGGGLVGWIPASIIFAMLAMLIVEGVKRLLEFFQRARA
jgi:hypothetical protein